MGDTSEHSSRGQKGRRSRRRNRKSPSVVGLFDLSALCGISVSLSLSLSLLDVGEAFSPLSAPSSFFPSSSLSLLPINHARSSTAVNGRSNGSGGGSSRGSHVSMPDGCHPFGTALIRRPSSLPRQLPLQRSSRTVLRASSSSQKHHKEEEEEKQQQQQQKQRRGKLKSPENDDRDDADNDDVAFDSGTAANLILGQSSLILASVLASFVLRIPNCGFGLQSSVHSPAVRDGILAAVPLFVLACISDRVEKSVPALADVTVATQRSVLTLLGGRFRPLLAICVAVALGAAAGLGEELLFRGVLQRELSSRFRSDALAVVASSLVFGSLHAATPLYALLASSAGVYFGWLFVAHDENLIVPVVCHGLYDVGALLWAHWSVTVQMNKNERMEIMNWKGGGPSGGDEKSKRGGRDKRVDIL